jgi:iron-sulfur cluster assembly protein
MITISEKAKEKILSLMEHEKLDNSYFLRVGVKGGGCAGIQYLMEFTNIKNSDDEEFEDKGVRILCNKISILYLFGTELTFSDGLNGKGFQWENPNATRSCSCGISFSA